MRPKKVVLFLSLCFSFVFVCNSQSGIINTIIGNGVPSYSGDGGPASAAEIYFPFCVIIGKNGDVFISDWVENRIRKITASSGIITTVAGIGGFGGYSGDGGQATLAELDQPCGIALDSTGNLFIADEWHNIIRKVDDSTGIITTVAGNGYQAGGSTGGWFSGDGGPATVAELNRPQAVYVDKSENIYIADYYNNLIRKVTDSTGIISTIAGNGYGGWRGVGTWTGAYAGDGGQATDAELYGPAGITVDDSNNIIISDCWNNAVRMVKSNTGIITTIAGTGIAGYTGNNGPATSAKVNYPVASLDQYGNMYISDCNNNVIRLVTKSTGIITTIAGIRTGGFSGDGGPATAAELAPQFVMPDDSGNFYIADAGNNRIRKVTHDTDTVTGINELIAKNEELRVFPNPSNGVFNLYLSNVSAQSKVEVFNYLGENIYQSKINFGNTEINLGGQLNGIYLYRVISQTGALVGEGKVVIEK
jgi:trimeric autotransporter adhesin